MNLNFKSCKRIPENLQLMIAQKFKADKRGSGALDPLEKYSSQPLDSASQASTLVFSAQRNKPNMLNFLDSMSNEERAAANKELVKVRRFKRGMELNY